MANSFERAGEAGPTWSPLAIGLAFGSSGVVVVGYAAGVGAVVMATVGIALSAVILWVGVRAGRPVRTPLAPLGGVYDEVVIRAPKAGAEVLSRSSGADAA